jgi:hypothetical protein
MMLCKAVMRRSEGRRSRHEELVQNKVNNVSKTLSFIKIHPLELDISSIECQKTPEIEFTHSLTFN